MCRYSGKCEVLLVCYLQVSVFQQLRVCDSITDVGCNTQAKEICHLRNLLDAQLHYFANAYTKLTEQEEFLAELEEYIGKVVMQ